MTFVIIGGLCSQIASPSLLQGKNYKTGENQTLTIQPAAYFDVSKPLTEMKPMNSDEVKRWKKGIVKNGFRYKTGNGPTSPVNDSTWQKQQGGKAVMAPIVNIEGANNGDNSPYLTAPPDTQGDVGPNHYVQMVNNVTEIFNKSGTSIWGPQPSSTFWSGFTGSWTGTNDGDPIVLYDQQADRWLVSQFAVNTSDEHNGNSLPFLLLVIRQEPITGMLFNLQICRIIQRLVFGQMDIICLPIDFLLVLGILMVLMLLFLIEQVCWLVILPQCSFFLILVQQIHILCFPQIVMVHSPQWVHQIISVMILITILIGV